VFPYALHVLFSDFLGLSADKRVIRISCGRGGLYHLVDGLHRFERGGAQDVSALVINLFDCPRKIAAGTGVRRTLTERAEHHSSSPRAFRSASRSRSLLKKI
jgi:hypothetical protein